MRYAVEMGSGAMIYIPSSVNIGSGIQKLIEGEFTDTQHGSGISLLYDRKLRIKHLTTMTRIFP
jgi:hypothetical protein